MNEVWKDVPEFEGYYQVSNLGNVRNKRGKNLTLQVNAKGYYVVYLSKYGKCYKKFVHKLVAEVFVLKPEELESVTHKDTVKKNNRDSNLEWCGCPYLPKCVIQMDLDYNVIGEFQSLAEAERKTGISRYCISSCCNNRTSRAGKFRWKFKEERHE